MSGEQQAAALAERAADDAFAARLYDDPLSVLRGEGFDDLAAEVEREIGQIETLVARLSGDDEFRTRLEDEPVSVLTEWGVPAGASVPVLEILGAPEEVTARAASDDVELHARRATASAATAAAVLGALAFAQTATAAGTDGIRYSAAGVEQVEPSGVRHGSVDPNPYRWGNPQPSGFRMGKAEANPIKWGSKPAASKWGSVPQGLRWSALQSFLRKR